METKFIHQLGVSWKSMKPKTLVALECKQIANENNATRKVFCYKLKTKQKQDNPGNNSESTDKNWSI